MINFVNGIVELKSLEIKDIIDVSVLQQFLDNFAIGMNCAAVSVDRLGREVTKPSYYREFCSNYIHKSHIGDERCAVCHNRMGEEAIRLNRPYIGKCHAGLIDFAAPIIINGEHLGTVLGGQILDRKPDEIEIRQTASEIRVNPDELWDKANLIDIVPMKNIEAAAEILYVVVNYMALQGYNRIVMEHMSSDLVNNFQQIATTVDTLAITAQDITHSQHELSNRINNIGTATSEISDVLKSITGIADKTKLIGLNASIETARLGNAGRSISIVANEIRTLSDHTKQTTRQIEQLNTHITEDVKETIKNADKTLCITEEQSSAMEELSATTQNMLELTERLKELFS